MFLTCQISDAASCLSKITNRINLWMAKATRPDLSLKKNVDKKETLQLSTNLLESNMLLQHIIKTFRSELVKSCVPKDYLEQWYCRLHINTKKAGYDGLLPKTCSGQFTATCSLTDDEEKRDKNKEKEEEKGGFASLRNNLIFIPRYQYTNYQAGV